MKATVLAGPSIWRLDRSPYSNIRFLPPAASGDISMLVEEGCQVIGLIDGYYGDCAAVWHKEILYALSKGIAVLGAASMGALRAAECDSFGMTGLGEVYQAFRDGHRTSDADVAVIHAPAELHFRPLTIALVDVDATIDALETEIAPQIRRCLVAAARDIHFSKRTWRSIAMRAGLEPALADELSMKAVSVKECDARALLDVIQAGVDFPPSPAGWAFQSTVFFENLLNRQGARRLA